MGILGKGTGKLALIWVSAFLACLLSACPTFAGDKVKVGCVDIGNFISIGPDGIAVGYGAEYLDKIAEYTGWEYEYVEASWSDCLELLKQGEIDLLLPAEYSQERAMDFLYSDYECCVDFAALVGRKADKRLYYDDYEGFDGIRVGMIQGNYLNGLFEDYAKEHGFSYEPAYYDTGTQLVDALNTEAVDAIINGNMEYSADQKLLSKIEYMPAYFITSKDNPELMAKLNQALKRIYTENPYYTADLYRKYYDYIGLQFVELTKEESQFISRSGPIRVLVSTDSFPYEWYDKEDGACKGAYVEFMKRLAHESGLVFNFIPDSPEKAGRAGLSQGRADVLLSAYNEAGENAQPDVRFTGAYYECHYSLIGKKDSALNLSSRQRIAVLGGYAGVEDYLAESYPQWEISEYTTLEACFQAVEKGMADCALAASLAVSSDMTLLGPDLVVLDGNTVSLPVRMCVSRRCDPLLVSVLSKAITKAGDKVMDECIFSTMLSGRESMNKNLNYYMRSYPLYFTGLVAALCFLGAGVLLVCHDSRQQKKQNQLLQKKNQELEEAIALQSLFRRKAQTDFLTELMNKSAAEEFCRSYIENNPEECCALFVLDLDNFKKVNDQLGHQTGDQVLRIFSAVLRGCVGPGDLVGRIGGDEFLLFLTGVGDEARVRTVADRIYDALKRENRYQIACSMGIVLAKCGQMSYEQWFKQADQVLYRAKGDGKNIFLIENALSARVAPITNRP